MGILPVSKARYSAVGRYCHTSSPASYGSDPVFPRSSLDFGAVHSLQYVQTDSNRELTEGESMNRRRQDPKDGVVSTTPEPVRHGWFRPMKRRDEEFKVETEKAVRPNLPSLPEMMGALRRGGSQVSLEKRPDLGYVVVRHGRVVAAAAMRIHLCIDLREWMVSNGLWP